VRVGYKLAVKFKNQKVDGSAVPLMAYIDKINRNQVISINSFETNVPVQVVVPLKINNVFAI
jgi:hypothetical protein